MLAKCNVKYGSSPLPPICKINYASMQYKYVHMSTCIMINLNYMLTLLCHMFTHLFESHTVVTTAS